MLRVKTYTNKYSMNNINVNKKECLPDFNQKPLCYTLYSSFLFDSYEVNLYTLICEHDPLYSYMWLATLCHLE